MFNEDSAVVVSWVRLIRSQKRTREQVPDISNLREIVYWVLDRVKREERQLPEASSEVMQINETEQKHDVATQTEQE